MEEKGENYLKPCPPPVKNLWLINLFCALQEYKSVGESQAGPAPAVMTARFKEDFFMFGFNLASTDIISKKEVWAYPAISFFAEMCGSLREGFQNKNKRRV